MVQNDSHPAAAALAGLWTSRPVERMSTISVRPPSTIAIRGLVEALRTELVENGVSADAILADGRIALPGAYDDVARKWDMLVMDDGELVAVVDFRTQTGFGAGKNIRNRMSDFVATAANFGRAHSSSDDRSFRPFLGVVFVMEETPETTHELASRASETYIKRFRDFFRRLVNDQMYDAICYLTATGPDPIRVGEPDPMMGFEVFARTIAQHVVAFRRLRDRNHDPAVASIALRLSSRNDLSKVISALNDTIAGYDAVERTGEKRVTSTGL
jgi:hypothetical protein